MAQHVLGRGASRPYSPGAVRKNRIASGATGRRYRAAYRRAERYAWLLRQARRLAALFFTLTQATWPARQFFGNLTYAAVGVALRLRDRQQAAGVGAAVPDEAEKPPVRPINRRKLHLRINTALAFLAAGMAFFTLATYRVGLEVFLDDNSIGFVAGQEVVEDSLLLAADAASEILGVPYTPTNNIRYQYTIVNRNAIFNRQETVESLLLENPEIERLYTLRVDGETVGASDDRAMVESLLNQVLASYTAAATAGNPRIVNDVSLDVGLVSRALLRCEDEFLRILTSNHSDEVRHRVTPDDTPESIASSFGICVDTLQELNWHTDVNNLSDGQNLLVRKRVPRLSVSFDVQQNHIEDIPFETQYIYDETLWLGDTPVQAQGVPGRERVYTLQRVVDGYPQPVQVVRRETLEEPTDRVIVIGQRTRAATGTFIRPTNGRFTSGFGYRTLFGRRQFHYGADFASPTGTPIAASDGGVVRLAGWGPSGYGLKVVIDHGNGFSTAYAHCSRVLVNVGQTVGQGETIALVGNTGRSTGPHLHFEVRVNGVRRNPMQFLQ